MDVTAETRGNRQRHDGTDRDTGVQTETWGYRQKDTDVTAETWGYRQRHWGTETWGYRQRHWGTETCG